MQHEILMVADFLILCLLAVGDFNDQFIELLADLLHALALDNNTSVKVQHRRQLTVAFRVAGQLNQRHQCAAKRSPAAGAEQFDLCAGKCKCRRIGRVNARAAMVKAVCRTLFNRLFIQAKDALDRALADFLDVACRFFNQGGNAAILVARSGVGLRQRLAVLLEEIVAAGRPPTSLMMTDAPAAVRCSAAVPTATLPVSAVVQSEPPH